MEKCFYDFENTIIRRLVNEESNTVFILLIDNVPFELCKRSLDRFRLLVCGGSDQCINFSIFDDKTCGSCNPNNTDAEADELLRRLKQRSGRSPVSFSGCSISGQRPVPAPN
jgi:hypothetical protein